MSRELTFARAGAPLGAARQIVVFVHGYGADGADLISLADPLGPHMPDTAFFAPNAPEPCAGNPFGRQWFAIPRFDGSTEAQAKAGLTAAAQDLNAFLDARLKDEGLGPDRLILLGFSQGAMMSLHIAPRRDTPIGGVVAISGKMMYPMALAGEAKVKPEVLLIHGDCDDVVPFGEMHLAGQALQEAGFATYAHVMRGTGHTIAPDGLQVALAFMTERLGLA